MSTLTADTLLPLAPAPGVTPQRVAKAEWIKFRSLRSTWYSLGAAMVVAIGLGISSPACAATTSPITAAFPPAARSRTGRSSALRGLFLAQLAVGVLGVLMITGEYSTGMIRASLSAVPRPQPGACRPRSPVIGGATFVARDDRQPHRVPRPARRRSAATTTASRCPRPGALRAVIGGGLFLALVALLGLGLRFRASAAPGARSPPSSGCCSCCRCSPRRSRVSWQNHVVKYLPLNAGSAVMSTVQRSDSFWAHGPASACSPIWSAVALGIGLVMLRRRDA